MQFLISTYVYTLLHGLFISDYKETRELRANQLDNLITVLHYCGISMTHVANDLPATISRDCAFIILYLDLKEFERIEDRIIKLDEENISSMFTLHGLLVGNVDASVLNVLVRQVEKVCHSMFRHSPLKETGYL